MSKRVRKTTPLSKVHLRYLTRQTTLKLWAGLPATERVKLFHRRFTEARITPARLYKVYKKYDIRRKRVKHSRKSVNYGLTEYVEQMRSFRE